MIHALVNLAHSLTLREWLIAAAMLDRRIE